MTAAYLPDPPAGSTFEFWEKTAALLRPDGRVGEYRAHAYEQSSEPAVRLDGPYDVRNLRTGSLHSCAGAVLRTDRTIGMVHAYNPRNLDELISAMLEDWRTVAAPPQQAALYLTRHNAAQYMDVLVERLPEARIAERRVNCYALCIVAGHDIPDPCGEAHDWHSPSVRRWFCAKP